MNRFARARCQGVRCHFDQAGRGSLHRRLLAFEPLEDRRLLSITVDTLVDENDGIGVGGISLRDAIAAAVSGDTIDFAPSLTSGGPATILLTHGELTIANKALTINGPGATLLTIDASGNDPTPNSVPTDGNLNDDGDGSRVFLINGPGDLNTSISGLTLTGGDADGDGGAIECYQNLTIADCTISKNISASRYGWATFGGGIQYRGGNLTINRCTISENFAEAAGGGVLSGNNTTISETTIHGNQAWYGGGLTYQGGPIGASNCVITHSTISENYASSGQGGGIKVGGNVVVTSSTISDNAATQGGGGLVIDASYGEEDEPLTSVEISDSAIIANSTDFGVGGGILSYVQGTHRDDLVVVNSTISANSSDNAGGGIAGIGTFVNCTITNNRADSNDDSVGSGGGISAGSYGGGSLLINTIVAGNLRGTATPVRDDVAGAVDVTFSLLGDNTGATITDHGGNLIGTAALPIDPLLGPLANNGGPTLTHALLAGGPAIDAGDPTAMAGVGGVPVYDQRGTPFDRVRDGDGSSGPRIDMGAFEVQEPPAGPALLGDYNENNVVDAADYIVWRHTLGTSVPPGSGADGSGNGTIDQADYDVWRANFGNTAPPAAGAAAGGADAATSAFVSDPPILLASVSTTSSMDSMDAPRSTNLAVLPPFELVPQTTASLGGLSRRASANFRPTPVLRDEALLAWLAARTDGDGPASSVGDRASDQARETAACLNVEPAEDSRDIVFDSLNANALLMFAEVGS